MIEALNSPLNGQFSAAVDRLFNESDPWLGAAAKTGRYKRGITMLNFAAHGVRILSSTATHAATDHSAGTSSPPCGVTIVMAESRELSVDGYWTKAIALNYEYALHHGYGFVLVLPPAHLPVKKLVWCKIRALLEEMRSRLHASAQCTWLAYLDSDAFLATREPLPALLHHHGVDDGVDFVLAREEAEPEHNFTMPFLLNTGVLFVRASAWSAAMLRAWDEGHKSLACQRFHRQSEQQCLERLLLGDDRAGLPHPGVRRVAISPMRLFNSPWGRYVVHIWGDPPVRNRRQLVFGQALEARGVRSTTSLAKLVEGVRKSARKGMC